MAVSREEVLRVLEECQGNRAEAGRRLGLTRERVRQVVVKKDELPKRRGRPKGVPNKGPHVGDLPLVDRPKHHIGESRSNKTNLQVRGLYTRAQQKLQVVLSPYGAKGRLARELGYRAPSVIYWLCDGSIARPTLYIAVELEKRYGIRCVEWFEPHL